jgi:release factor glutamine methyltransferase
LTDARGAAVAARLASAGCVAPAAEAGELLAAATDDEQLEEWLVRRERGEPLAWLTGTTTFAGRPLRVMPGVYVPRPQTEVLAQRAATHLPRGGSAVDLCTGTGAVAAHLRRADPTAMVIGVDLDPDAARCARANGVLAVVADVDTALHAEGSIDVVTAVAPYVTTPDLRLLPSAVQRHEPRRALDGGADGLDLERRVVAAAARLLRPGGRLLVELGGGQDTELQPALDQAGFMDVEPWFDEDGDLRGLEARTRDGRPEGRPQRRA